MTCYKNLPATGRIIGYRYLWSHESESGKIDGTKDRPCVVLKASEDNGDKNVVVLPVTHSMPDNPEHAVEIPAKVKKSLGLDDRPSWVVCNEVNHFKWPGPDLAHIPVQGGAKVDVGALPPGIWSAVLSKAADMCRQKEISIIARPDYL